MRYFFVLCSPGYSPPLPGPQPSPYAQDYGYTPPLAYWKQVCFVFLVFLVCVFVWLGGGVVLVLVLGGSHRNDLPQAFFFLKLFVKFLLSQGLPSPPLIRSCVLEFLSFHPPPSTKEYPTLEVGARSPTNFVSPRTVMWNYFHLTSPVTENHLSRFPTPVPNWSVRVLITTYSEEIWRACPPVF